MTLPRVTLGSILLAVALIAFHLALVGSTHPAFGLDNLELGLLPGVTALALSLPWARRRHNVATRAFAAALGLAIAIYLTLCVATPDLVCVPVVHYLNEIEPHLYDADHSLVYRLSLEIQGLILGLPQVLFAIAVATLAAIHTRSNRRSLDAD